jgi:glyoxylase-like metal-dependent hydrolase (beta-lactamase superfamily II)
VVVEKIGKIAEGVYMLGHRAAPIFLVDGGHPALFDGGMAFLAPHYNQQIRNILGNRQPAYCFLTHSHWDHCGAVTYLKHQFPRMRVVCSQKVADVLARPNAVALIAELNRSSAVLAADWGIDASDTSFEPFGVDIVAREGHRFGIASGQVVQAMETPGHTWDFLSYFIPGRRLLMASEALGTRDETGGIIVDCLVDYDACRHSMQRLNALDVEILLLGHVCSFTGQDARQHIRASIRHLRRFKTMVERLMIQARGNLDAVKKQIKAVEWDYTPGMRQPEPAYLLNLDARINAVLRQRQRATNEKRGTTHDDT